MQRVEFHPAGMPEGVRRAFAEFDRAFAGVHGVEVDRNRLRHVERVEIEGTTCYLKRFHGIQWKNQWWLRRSAPPAWSQAEREFRVARALEEAGLRPGRPLLFADHTGGLLRRERQSLFLSEALPGPSFRERLAAGTSGAEREAMRRAAAAVLGRAFAHGITLPDLSLDHLFWLESAPTPEHRVGLIDFHNGSTGARPRRRAVLRALRHLARSVARLDPEARLVRPRARLWFLVRFLSALPWLPPPRAFARKLPRLLDHDYDTGARARRYRTRSPARAAREARLLTRVLGDTLRGRTVLDAPAGACRLLPVLTAAGAARVVQADRATAMLRAAPAADAAPHQLTGDLRRLPLRDGSVDVAVCFRFLHHLAPDQARAVVLELCRVARERVVLSFFHAGSLHHLRRWLATRLNGRPTARHALTRTRLADWFRAAGFALEAARGELPGLRELWVVRARRVGGADRPAP